MLDVNLREPDVQPLVREMLFDMSWVTHLRNKKRHCLRPFGRAIQEKRHKFNPIMVCGLNVEKMIQEKLVSSHVVYHFVHEADAPSRTTDDILHTGIWPEH